MELAHCCDLVDDAASRGYMVQAYRGRGGHADSRLLLAAEQYPRRRRRGGRVYMVCWAGVRYFPNSA